MSEIQIATDLRSLFGPVRDQGARPTCLAFAASDCHASLRKEWYPLSCEYAFYNAQLRAGLPPDRGARLTSMLDALREDGQPVESGWPYMGKTPADFATWSPPGSPGQLFARDGSLIQATVDQVIVEVEHRRPVIILLKLCAAFFSANPAIQVVDAEVSALPVTPQRHAIVVVGHGTLESGRVLLIRNSWGPGWGNGGYAWLAEGYLSPRMFAASVLKDDIYEFRNTAIA